VDEKEQARMPNNDIEEIIEKLYPDVKEYVQSQVVVTITGLQRKFMTGYILMARIVDRLEAEGIVGENQIGIGRKVLFTK
jgi:DNA segregation ATPase FtsK/SpoIIIE-like protein